MLYSYKNENHETAQLEQEFRETLLDQLSLIAMHKSQFETIMSNEQALQYLPENLKKILSTGYQGLQSYLQILESLQKKHLALQKSQV